MGLTRGLVDELDAVGDWGLLTTDADLRIIGWNRWLEQRAGQPASAVLGRPLFERFPDLLTRKFDRYYRQALQGQTVILSQRLHGYTLSLPPPRTGTIFPQMQQSSRIIPLMEGEQVVGTVTLVEDVTERVVSEKELRRRLDELRENDRRKDEFLAMLAHELRNPLAPITNAMQILRLIGAKEPALAGVRDMIERQVRHMVRLVDDLLDISRISSGKFELQKVKVDLCAVVRQALEASQPLLDSRKHDVQLSVPSEPIFLEGDFIRLAQVVSNLINNAAKYTDPGGTVWVTVERHAPSERGEAIVRIRDNGRGIEPNNLQNLFRMFYQVDRNLDRSDGGLGVGLALVKNIVEMHGGTVAAQSAGQGWGSEFTVTLPAFPQDAAAQQSTKRHSAANAAPRRRILVVDDNRDSADSMALFLQLEGHDVATTYDGEAAVKLGLEWQPDVILLDVGLPKLSGIEACRALRRGKLTRTLMIAMTGFGQDVDRELSKQAGFDLHMTKPVNLDALRKTLSIRSAGE